MILCQIRALSGPSHESLNDSVCRVNSKNSGLYPTSKTLVYIRHLELNLVDGFCVQKNSEAITLQKQGLKVGGKVAMNFTNA